MCLCMTSLARRRLSGSSQILLAQEISVGVILKISVVKFGRLLVSVCLQSSQHRLLRMLPKMDSAGRPDIDVNVATILESARALRVNPILLRSRCLRSLGDALVGGAAEAIVRKRPTRGVRGASGFRSATGGAANQSHP